MKNSQITVGMPCEVLGGLTGYKTDTYYIDTNMVVVTKDVKELERYRSYAEIKETQVALVLEDGTTLTGVHTLSIRSNSRYVLVARREGDKLVAFKTVTKARLVSPGTRKRMEDEAKVARDDKYRRDWEQGLELQRQARYVLEHLPTAVVDSLTAEYILESAAEGPRRHHDGSVNTLRHPDVSRVADLYAVAHHFVTATSEVGV